MSELLNRELLGTPVLSWLLALAVALAVMTLVTLAIKFKTRGEKEQEDYKAKVEQRREEARQRFHDILNNMLQHTRKSIVFMLAAYLSMRAFDIAPDKMSIADKAILVAVLLQVGWWGEGLVTQWFEDERQRHIPHGARHLARLLVWIVVVLVAVDSLGIDISGVITGLGLTGVAVALSTRQILGDLFAFFSITSDQPFKLGDYIIVDDCMGDVENIGLRSTRIRSLNGEQVVFANSVLLDKRIQNYKTMKARRIVTHIGVVYETPYEKLIAIPDLIAEIFQSIDLANFDRAHFSDYGESSLEFEIVYLVMTSDYHEYIDIRHKINPAIYEKFEEQGIEFAYPTRRLLLNDDMPDM